MLGMFQCETHGSVRFRREVDGNACLTDPSSTHFISVPFFRCSHVMLPKELAKTLPKSRLLTESEWRGIGVQQSRGWQHYMIHRYVLCSLVCAGPLE